MRFVPLRLSRDETIALTGRHLNPALAKLMAFAGMGVEARGEGCWVTDDEGHRLLDCLGGYGVFSLGHCPPAVVEAVRAQLDDMALGCKAMFSEPAARLAARLAELAPGGVECAFFCNSGAEAVEAALKFARSATGRPKLVSALGGYHGKTLGALSVTPKAKYQDPFRPLLADVASVPFGDASALAGAIDGETAAFIVEPIQGEGGIHLAPEGYLEEARRICDEAGALLIVDEVQTGLGRTGPFFATTVEPDLMCLGKALGGGVMPLAAVMGKRWIWEKVFGENPLAHTSTFGASPIACSAGLAAVEGCLAASANGAEVGAWLLGELQALAEASPLLVEARGRGMMIGVEFAADELAELTVAQMIPRGLLAAYTLNNPRVMRFEPPLIMTMEEARQAVEIFAESVAAVQAILKDLGLEP
jgi:putrescine aminotransferase